MGQFPKRGTPLAEDPGRPVARANTTLTKDVPELVKQSHQRLFGLGARMTGTYSRFRRETPDETAMSLRPRAADAGKDVRLPRTPGRSLTKKR